MISSSPLSRAPHLPSDGLSCDGINQEVKGGKGGESMRDKRSSKEGGEKGAMKKEVKEKAMSLCHN